MEVVGLRKGVQKAYLGPMNHLSKTIQPKQKHIMKSTINLSPIQKSYQKLTSPIPNIQSN